MKLQHIQSRPVIRSLLEHLNYMEFDNTVVIDNTNMIHIDTSEGREKKNNTVLCQHF